MNTEDDLRAVLSALEHQAPDPTGTLAGLDRLRHRRSTRRRAAVLVATAVVTMALAAGSLAAPKLFRTEPPAPQGQSTPAKRTTDGWNYGFAVDPGLNMRVAYHFVDKDYTSAFVLTEPDTGYYVEVYRPGRYDPTAARAGEPVDINGKPGFYRPDLPCRCSSNSPISGVAWEYAPNAWGTVRYQGHPPEPPTIQGNLATVARGVHTDQRTPLRVPFRVGYLPDGLAPGTSAMYTFSDVSKSALVKLDQANQASSGLMITTVPGGPNGAHPVGVPTSVESPLGGKPGEPGRPGHQVYINLGPFEVMLTSDGPAGPGLSVDELKRIASSITASGQISDPSTWLDAAEAIPVG